MDSKEVPSAVSVVQLIIPVSSLGMKPLGTIRKSTTVPSRIAREAIIAARRWSITQASVRS